MKLTSIYKALVLLELVTSTVNSFSKQFLYYSINEAAIYHFERHRSELFDARCITEFMAKQVSWLPMVYILGIFVLTFYIYYGLLIYKSIARILFLVTGPLISVIFIALAGVSLSHPITAVLSYIEVMLTGAVIAISYSGEVNEAFNSPTRIRPPLSTGNTTPLAK